MLLCFMINGLLLEVRGESCTEGFIDYSLLQSTSVNLVSLIVTRLAYEVKLRTPSNSLVICDRLVLIADVDV